MDDEQALVLPERWIVREPTLRRLGAVLGAAAGRGDTVALVGPLGAGKTALARAIVLGAGVPADVRVTSPTFAVVLEYAARLPVHHADLYRLGGADELAEIGLVERAAEALLIVEWADRFPEVLPRDALWITLEPFSATQRIVTLRAAGPSAEAMVRAVVAWTRGRRSIRGA